LHYCNLTKIWASLNVIHQSILNKHHITSLANLFELQLPSHKQTFRHIPRNNCDVYIVFYHLKNI
jgi:hypothetical protein